MEKTRSQRLREMTAQELLSLVVQTLVQQCIYPWDERLKAFGKEFIGLAANNTPLHQATCWWRMGLACQRMMFSLNVPIEEIIIPCQLARNLEEASQLLTQLCERAAWSENGLQELAMGFRDLAVAIKSGPLTPDQVNHESERERFVAQIALLQEGCRAHAKKLDPEVEQKMPTRSW